MASFISPLAVRRRLVPTGDVASIESAFYATARSLVLFGADCIAITLAGLVVFHLSKLASGWCCGVTPLDKQTLVVDLAAPFAGILAFLIGRGRYTDRISFWNEMRIVVCVAVCAVGIEGALGFLTGDIGRRLPAIGSILIFSIGAVVANHLAKQALAAFGLWLVPAVIIGDHAGTAQVDAAMTTDGSLGYQIVRRIEPAAAALAAMDGPRLKSLLARYRASFLLIAISDEQQRGAAVESALRERIPFAVVVPHGFSCRLTPCFGQDAMLLSYRDGLSRPMPRLFKAIFDVTFAILLLFIASPLLLIIAAIVRSDGGPVLFAHRRIGAGGRHFYCLKFRTMVVNADQVLQRILATDPERAAEWRATHKLRDDPRVTRLGKLLRQMSLDEVPQLLNVIRLEMSLVGPRPIVDSEIAHYGEDIAHYYALRPGLTGLWQVSGRSDTSYARRVRLDVWYVNNWTIWHDLAVLLKTIPAVLRREGAR